MDTQPEQRRPRHNIECSEKKDYSVTQEKRSYYRTKESSNQDWGTTYLTRSPIHPSTDGQKSWGRLNLCREELRNPPTKGTKVFRHRNVVGELPLIPPAARMGDYSRIRTQHCIQCLGTISSYSNVTREARENYDLSGQQVPMIISHELHYRPTRNVRPKWQAVATRNK